MPSRPQIAWTAEHGAGNEHTEIQYRTCIYVCKGCKVQSLASEPRQEWPEGSAGECVMTPIWLEGSCLRLEAFLQDSHPKIVHLFPLQFVFCLRCCGVPFSLALLLAGEVSWKAGTVRGRWQIEISLRFFSRRYHLWFFFCPLYIPLHSLNHSSLVVSGVTEESLYAFNTSGDFLRLGKLMEHFSCLQKPVEFSCMLVHV